MLRASFFLPVLLVISLWVSSAQAAWKIEFNSGSAVEANACRIEKGRIYLKYPVGEVSFPLSEVKSVVMDDRAATELQTAGTPQAASTAQAREDSPAAELNQPSAPAPWASVQAAPSSPASPGNKQDFTKPQFTSESLNALVANSVEIQGEPVAPCDPQLEAIMQAMANTTDAAQQAALLQKMNNLIDAEILQNQ